MSRPGPCLDIRPSAAAAAFSFLPGCPVTPAFTAPAAAAVTQAVLVAVTQAALAAVNVTITDAVEFFEFGSDPVNCRRRVCCRRGGCGDDGSQ